MKVLSNINEINEEISQWKRDGLTIGLVPTMGALHKGHKSLIDKARELCDKVVVSIFVNPTQFGPTEDFDKYPKTFESDSEICQDAGADLIFIPKVKEMYPDFLNNKTHEENVKAKENLTLVVSPKSFTDKLCGKSRIGHFDGVTTVVTKLFNITLPDLAFFGQKDIQQVVIIKKMQRDLNFPIEIISCPIVREENGLALSSRNSYLTEEDREKASSIYKVLLKIEELFKNGIFNKKDITKEALNLLNQDIELEYLEFVDLNKLDYLDELKHNTIVAIAVKIAGVRLIDNIII